MIYEWTISTPITFSIGKKKRTVLDLEFGEVQELLIDFPPGSAGLHFLHINHGLSQVFPKSKGYFHGDRVLFEFRNVRYPVFTEPYKLIAYTWNDSTRFSHNVTIYINLLRMGVFV